MYAVSGIRAFSAEFKVLPPQWLERVGQLVAGLVAAAAVISLVMVLLWRTKDRGADPERRAYVILLSAIIAVSLLNAIFVEEDASNLMQTDLRALPIPFLFATMFYNERAVFFDVVAKQGLFTLAMLLLLVSYAKESLDIVEFSLHRGGASVLDFLDAERTYRATQLAYRQELAPN